MKKLLLLFLMSVALFGCKSKTAKEEVKTESASNVHDQALKYKFKQGDKFTYKVTNSSDASQMMKQGPQSKSAAVNQSVTYLFDMEVKEVDKDGTGEIEISCKAITADLKSPDGKEIKFDSKNKLAATEQAKFADYSSLIDNPYRIRVNYKGEVIEVMRTDKILDKMLSLRGLKDKLSDTQKAQAAEQVSQNTLKPLSQLMFKILSDKKLSKDSTWINTTPMSMGAFQIENKATYRVLDFLKSGSDNLVNLSASLEAVAKGKGTQVQNGVTYNMAQPKISGTGNILFNITKGRIQHAETSNSVEMNMKITAKTPKGLIKAERYDRTFSKNTIDVQ